MLRTQVGAVGRRRKHLLQTGRHAQREFQRLKQLVARRSVSAAPPVVKQRRSRGAGCAAGRAQPRALRSALGRQRPPGARFEPEAKLSSSKNCCNSTLQASGIPSSELHCAGLTEVRHTKKQEHCSEVEHGAQQRSKHCRRDEPPARAMQSMFGLSWTKRRRWC